MTYRKKLIEVSLPLEAINVASAREKSIRHGHPSTLHLWWARRPLAACRAVLFSSLVDDPSEYMPDEESARIERERLFDIIEKLVIWENSNDEEVLYEAQLEIARSVARNLNVDVPIGKEAVREFLATKAPPVLDPFAGGGSIPLEAQRLGLRAYASDLNPVAVLINKALIEIPPKFANMPPIHPVEEAPVKKGKGKKGEETMPLWQKEWKGAQGLAEDVRYYGKWMRDEAFKRIGHLYPPVTITKEIFAERPDLKEQGYKPGDQLTVIAWIWARTVKCPNPACGVRTPLIRTFSLNTKKTKKYWIEIKQDLKKISYKINSSSNPNSIPQGTVSRLGAICVSCKAPISFDYISNEGKQERIEAQLIGIATEGKKSRAYFSPISEHERLANSALPKWTPDTNLPLQALGFRVQRYGMSQHANLFTGRQLVTLSLLSDMVLEIRNKIIADLNSRQNDFKTNRNINEYASSVATYLALGVSKTVNRSSALAPWMPSVECPGHIFSRQAVSMNWDFAEANILSGPSGSFESMLDNTIAGLVSTEFENSIAGIAVQSDATADYKWELPPLVSTDPPYYDNISYADLSDLFYVWLRKALRDIYPDLFDTLLTPKSQELVAEPFRHGSRENARSFFENTLTKVFQQVRKFQEEEYPFSVFYAFRQSETEEAEDSDDSNPSDKITASTGWETMLEGLIKSGYSITGTWPMRTERMARSRNIQSNALISSIVLICRPRSQKAESVSRREFLSVLKKELSPALRELQQGSIAPVDLAQASIGPGMAVYSRYSAVLEADGKPMSVRTALTLINQALDEFLAEQEGEYDGDTRWALTWFEQYGHNEAAYGVAETLSRAKNTSVDGLSEAGIVEARGGKVRLYRREELDTDWDPTTDKRLTAWESAAHLIYALENGGEESAAELLAKLGPVAEVARDLAYRLYTVCERKGWAQDALGYNMLVVAWPRLKELAARKVEPGQGKLI